MNRFVFNPEATRLKQVICDLHCLVSSLINNNGEKLNGELKAMERIANKTNEIKKQLENSNESIT